MSQAKMEGKREASPRVASTKAQKSDNFRRQGYAWYFNRAALVQPRKKDQYCSYVPISTSSFMLMQIVARRWLHGRAPSPEGQ